MDDIEERLDAAVENAELRDWQLCMDASTVIQNLRSELAEAADEITRLRAALINEKIVASQRRI